MVWYDTQIDGSCHPLFLQFVPTNIQITSSIYITENLKQFYSDSANKAGPVMSDVSRI